MTNRPCYPLASAALLAALAAAPRLHAQNSTLTWIGSTDAELRTVANWSGGTVTDGTDALIFGAAGTAGTNLTLAAAGLNAGYSGSGVPAIDFTASAPAYTFSGAGQLTAATGGLRNQSGQTQTFNNPFRFNTGSGHTLSGANSALVFGGTVTLQAATTTINMGTAAGHSVTFNGNLANPTANTLTFGGSSNASTVNINGAANTGLGTLTIGQNVRVNLGSATALGSATTVNLNGGGSTIANTSGSALTTNASLAPAAAAQNYTFGAVGHTAANNLSFNGTAAINADQTRTLTLNGTGLTVTSASVWNNTVTGNRTLTVNGAGNTFGIGGFAVGASGETANVRLEINGTGNVAISGGVTNGLGTGTRSFQVNNAGTVSIQGSSDYTGTTGIGGNATLLVNGTHSGGANYSVAGILGGTGTIDLSSSNATVAFVSSGDGRLQASSVDTLTIIGGAASAITLNNSIDTEAGRLLFTLGAPGTTAVDVQGMLTIGSGFLDFGDFSFTAGPGFGAGVYRLFDYTSIVGTLGTSLTGTIGGLSSTISNDVASSAIIVTVVPEPSAFAALAGLAGLGVAASRRRRHT